LISERSKKKKENKKRNKEIEANYKTMIKRRLQKDLTDYIKFHFPYIKTMNGSTQSLPMN
jgi:hypothetical protein